MLEPSAFPYGFRVVDGRDQERRLCDFNAAFVAHLGDDERADNGKEVYLSAYQFSQDFREYLKTHGTTKGFSGPTWSPWLWFDIDRDSFHDAMTDARRLVGFLCDRWTIDAESLLLFFSGRKGFHIGLPTSLWNAQPAAAFHEYTKHFAKSLASLADVVVDDGVYDRVRLFRAPNSRHQRSGLRKRRLTADEFFRLSADAMLTQAQEPQESELPKPVPLGERAAADWTDAVSFMHKHAEAVSLKGSDDARLNALTRVFINEGATSGDRHRLLYSAARNLAEFACPAALAHALLTPPGLDSGLSPSDVRRQIDCGLNDGGPHSG
jgi:hypothetical protein